jgi:aminopeptidase N
MTSQNVPSVVKRVDYTPPPYLVDRVDLRFELGFPTRITATIDFRRNGADCPFVLDGLSLTLLDVILDGATLPSDAYLVTPENLVVKAPPLQGKLTLVTEVMPARGGVEGLLVLGSALVTHCEPQGFRRLTYFPDRPDVMAIYSCTLIGAPADYPVMLSNGQLVDAGTMPDGGHFATWHDPYPKPGSMFALAVGAMEVLRDEFRTRGGRQVALAVYAQPEDIRYCGFGLDALKTAMRWDEDHYAREYDLNTLNMVVLRSYPGGAMEHKGLNLYAPESFVAAPEISTDEAMEWIRGIIAHEYLHNWTGNRVGLRDWFQLGLKEGFTILRNQDFWATEMGADPARIDDVARLMERQFPEDIGAMTHAVRPTSYQTVSNLFTNTIYLKGAEIIRMMRTIVGERRFAEAVDAFFSRCDGKAATVDELVDIVEDVSGVELGQFRAWYDVSGGVNLAVSSTYDADSASLTLTFEQSSEGGPLQIPLRIGLTDEQGQPVSLHADGRERGTTWLYELCTNRAEILFEKVGGPVVPAVLRGFSAPVHLSMDLAVDDLSLLALHDVDPVTRWMAAQELAVHAVLGRAGALDSFTRIVEAIFVSEDDPAIAARIAQMPPLRHILALAKGEDVGELAAARTSVAAHIGRRLHDGFPSAGGGMGRETAGQRRLRNLLLWYLTREAGPELVGQLRIQLDDHLANEALVALQMLIDIGGEVRRAALERTYLRWRNVPQLLDQWFAAQAGCEASDGASLAASMTNHPDFDLCNGTRLKAIFDRFATNLGALHDESGTGYAFVAGVAHSLCRDNPRLAVRLLRHLSSDLSRLDQPRRDRLQQAVTSIVEQASLAPELVEVLEKLLNAASAPDQRRL